MAVGVLLTTATAGSEIDISLVCVILSSEIEYSYIVFFRATQTSNQHVSEGGMSMAVGVLLTTATAGSGIDISLVCMILSSEIEYSYSLFLQGHTNF